MTTKICGVCRCEKSMELFAKDSNIPTGRRNKCKQCTSVYNKKYRENNLEKARAHQTLYRSQPSRIAYRKAYEKTESYAKAHKNQALRYRAEHPNRVKAQDAINNAIKDGRLTRICCLICGEAKSEAHHPDYEKPFDVIWLCQMHHREAHALVSDISEAKAKI